MTEPDTSKRLSFQDHDVFLIPCDDSTSLVYAPTLRKLLRVTPALAKRLSNGGFAKRLEDRGVAEVCRALECGLTTAIEPFRHDRVQSRYFHLALGLTQSCNLACLYCHADAGGPPDSMSRELLEAALAHAFDTAMARDLSGVNVSFAVGGEPTTRWALFQACVNRIRMLQQRQRVQVHLSITTNGYYGHTKRAFLADAFDSILLSFDGPATIQDLHRPTKRGTASFPAVLASARYFAAHAKSVSYRVTVSDRSVESLVPIVDFFATHVGTGFHLVFEPLVPLGRATENQDTLAQPDQERFVANYLLAKERAREVGLEVRTSAAQASRLVSAFCGAMAIPSFTVTTAGIVTTCERDATGDTYGYGLYDHTARAFILDHEAMSRNEQLPTLRKECLDCFCKWHCAGDCPDLRQIGYNRCYVNRHLVQEDLEKRLAGWASALPVQDGVSLGGTTQQQKGG